LDVWILNLNKAIEYYWHDKPYQKIKDNIKKEQCIKIDIDLLVINDVEWLNNNKQYKLIIREFI